MTRYLLRLLRRPFSGTHWFLLTALVLLWEFTFFGQPCKEEPHYFEVVLSTATVCIALWANHIRVGQFHGVGNIAKIIGNALYDISLLSVLFILIGLPLAIVTPTYQCYTSRAWVSEMIVYTSHLRATISERAIQSKSLTNVGIGLRLLPSEAVIGALVTKDGTIVAASEEPPAVIILAPVFAASAVTWKCIGFPEKHMPASCRE